MKKDEYVETIVLKDKIINVGMDDEVRQYFFEFYDPSEKDIVKLYCISCDLDYKEEIKEYFQTDIERIWGTLTDHRQDIIKIWRELDTINKKLTELSSETEPK